MTALGEGVSVAEARRLLVTTVARARNTGMRYSEDGTRLLNIGRGPIRLEPVRLALRLDGATHEAIYYEITYAYIRNRVCAETEHMWPTERLSASRSKPLKKREL